MRATPWRRARSCRPERSSTNTSPVGAHGSISRSLPSARRSSGACGPISYLELARTVGDVRAVRAVGGANGKNPLPIVLPCHRVIGADGSLTGFGGGIERKRWLLEHEGAIARTPTLSLDL
jgi:O-6-methylguanine DNA methyltransferase